MKKLTKDHLIDGQVYSKGTEYEIIKEGMANDWPTLSHNEWQDMAIYELKHYLDNNDVNEKDENGLTALQWASTSAEDAQVIQTLIDKGADVNARAYNGNTSFMLAVMYNNQDILQALIDNGADVNEKLEYELTPLMIASRCNSNPRVIQVLIDNDVDVNARDANGKTALAYAAANKYKTRIIKVLVDNGATE